MSSASGSDFMKSTWCPLSLNRVTQHSSTPSVSSTLADILWLEWNILLEEDVIDFDTRIIVVGVYEEQRRWWLVSVILQVCRWSHKGMELRYSWISWKGGIWYLYSRRRGKCYRYSILKDQDHFERLSQGKELLYRRPPVTMKIYVTIKITKKSLAWATMTANTFNHAISQII